MKKAIIAFLGSGFLLITGLKAQSVQEGMNHYYAQRYTSAIGVFQNLIDINPNNVEATYWLGQTYLDMEEIMSIRIANTRKLYEKALQSSANAPLLLVGIGHVELHENNMNDSRQHFETALTMTRTKKGDDPGVLIAIGRAIADAKVADYKYGIEKLNTAIEKGGNNAEAYLLLGNAWRREGKGDGGGEAFRNYKKALEVNPNMAVASLRLAKLFESQKSWDLVLQYLEESVQKDPKFTAGYYELFYYYFYRQQFPQAEEQLKKYIDSKLPLVDIQDQFLYAQLCWAKKDFDCATQKAESVVAELGTNTKPKLYRLLADANFQKGDFQKAKKYSDEFFAKKNPDDLNTFDYKLRADILTNTGGTITEIFDTYMQGYLVDTVLSSKIDFLKQGAAYFKTKKIRGEEARIIQAIIALKPKPIINDYFDLSLAYYFDTNHSRSRDAALKMIEFFPDQVYGYEWAYNNSQVLDTVKKDSIALPDALKLFEFSQKDTAKYKKQYLNTIRYLAPYYINIAKDKEKALEYFGKWLEADPVNAAVIQSYIDQIKKIQPKPPVTPKTAPPAKTGKTTAGTSKAKTTTVKTSKQLVKK